MLNALSKKADYHHYFLIRKTQHQWRVLDCGLWSQTDRFFTEHSHQDAYISVEFVNDVESKVGIDAAVL